MTCSRRTLPHPLSLSVSSAVNRNRQASAASHTHIYTCRNVIHAGGTHRKPTYTATYIQVCSMSLTCPVALSASISLYTATTVCLAKNNHHHPTHTWNMNYGRQRERERHPGQSQTQFQELHSLRMILLDRCINIKFVKSSTSDMRLSFSLDLPDFDPVLHFHYRLGQWIHAFKKFIMHAMQCFQCDSRLIHL